jgi:hypothetical protein
MKKILKYSLINGLGTSLYVILIASFIYYLGNSPFTQKDTIFIPIAMLLLFVFSAAFTGILVFGKPLLWYLDGEKREAISLLFYTLIIFSMITLISFILLISLIH